MCELTLNLVGPIRKKNIHSYTHLRLPRTTPSNSDGIACDSTLDNMVRPMSKRRTGCVEKPPLSTRHEVANPWIYKNIMSHSALDTSSVNLSQPWE
jgi:hypothetical protein